MDEDEVKVDITRFFSDWKQMMKDDGFHAKEDCPNKNKEKGSRNYGLAKTFGYCSKCEPLLGKSIGALSKDDMLFLYSLIQNKESMSNYCIEEDISVYKELMEDL